MANTSMQETTVEASSPNPHTSVMISITRLNPGSSRNASNLAPSAADFRAAPARAN
jgi:hypothetical protein